MSKLIERKQRMFLIMPAHAVVIHKRYFSKQSKRLRNQLEIAHGITFFWGGVDKLARSLENQQVDSEDDKFWDKSYLVMEDVYKMRVRALKQSVPLTFAEQSEMEQVVSSMICSLVILPTGDVYQIAGRMNPSGADATTENNCIARKLIENYIRILHYESLSIRYGNLPSLSSTKYMGDDRVSGMKEFAPGYSEFYERFVGTTGVVLKTLVRTQGPIGAEFCGFTIAKKHWGHGYMPLYKLDRLFSGLFVPKDTDLNIGFTRFMAFSLLLYPHIEWFEKLRPLIISYCQQFPTMPLAGIAISWWSDVKFLQFMWDGFESTSDSLFSERKVDAVISYLVEEGYSRGPDGFNI